MVQTGIRIHLYSNASVHKRMIGYCVAYTPKFGLCNWAEVNFKPFGYFFTYNSPPPYPDLMADITAFSKLAYNQVSPIVLRTAYLDVKSMVIGQYENVKHEEY